MINETLFKHAKKNDNNVGLVHKIVEILEAADKDRIQFQWRQIDKDERLNRIEQKKEAIAKLIQQGADINSINDTNWTPLMHACFRGLPEFVDFFIEQGADITHTDDKGRTAQTLAEQSGLVLEPFPFRASL